MLLWNKTWKWYYSSEYDTDFCSKITIIILIMGIFGIGYVLLLGDIGTMKANILIIGIS